MSNDIAKQLECLPQLTRAELLSLWTEVFGHPLRCRGHKDFLIACIAYRLQEQAYGGLRPNTRKQLRKIASEIEAGSSASLDAPRIKLGTRLIREWNGNTHEVTVINEGFAYRGQPYRSLSEIARLITGTRWSGPLFFGLKGSHG